MFNLLPREMFQPGNFTGDGVAPPGVANNAGFGGLDINPIGYLLLGYLFGRGTRPVQQQAYPVYYVIDGKSS